MARALHLRAGRALAAASGSGQGTHFQEPSISDLRLLSRALPLAPFSYSDHSFLGWLFQPLFSMGEHFRLFFLCVLWFLSASSGFLWPPSRSLFILFWAGLSSPYPQWASPFFLARARQLGRAFRL
eukprot:SM000166S02483  [mRNA]  locus=s166:73104:73522:- [translate_table: standard]